MCGIGFHVSILNPTIYFSISLLPHKEVVKVDISPSPLFANFSSTVITL